MNVTMRKLASFTMLLWSVPAVAHAQGAHPQVNITKYKVGGSHCQWSVNQADTTIIVKPSVPGGPNDYFQLTYDAFTLQPGEDGNPSNVQGLYGDCLVEMDIEVPAGYQLSYVRYELDGNMDIGQYDDPKNVRGEERGEIATAFYLETAGPDRKWIADGRHSFSRTGPFSGDVEVMEDIALDSEQCESKVKLSMYTTATLESDTIIDSQSRLSIDRSSGNIGQAIRLYLAKCPS